MDDWVLRSQTWLNSTYGGRTGYINAPTNGMTGWSTMYSATRALQLELGITNTSDTFGPGTTSAFISQIGEITGATASQRPNVVGILQAVLWCKGYWGGTEFGVWDSDVASSVMEVKADVNLPMTAAVPVKLMKTLMTMDAYILVGGGSPKVREVQRYLNGSYWQRLDFGLVPCDGFYSRQVQQGLMYAIQYEIGMADGTANGNFGPGTRQGVRDYGTFGLGASDGSRHMVRLYQAALILNGYEVDSFLGQFDSSTQEQTLRFQEFVELAATGAANYSTWASLLVSTGDIDRPSNACDTATPLHPLKIASVKSAGYVTVGRYINGVDKRLQHDEAARIWSNGMRWFPIYQEWNDSADQFSYSLGYEQGERIAMRMRQMGIRSERRVYLSVDFDATEDDIYAVVIPHFQGVRDALQKSSAVTYRLGVYGTRNVCSTLAAEGLTESSFVSDMSTGYSGNLGFPLPSNWAYDQIDGVLLSPGSTSGIEIDKVIPSSRAEWLTESDVLRTPRRYENGAPAGFDEEFYWRIAGLCYLGDSSTSSSLVSRRNRNDTILNWLQRPAYWGGPEATIVQKAWQVYTGPAYAAHAPGTPSYDALMAAFVTLQERGGSELYPTPVAGRFGQTDHWAASTRGHLLNGVDGGGVINPGDLGGWALDLATFWESYEQARVAASGGVLDVRSWTAANLGGTSGTKFGVKDLRADMAAYLCAKRMNDQPDVSLDEIVRQVLVAIEDDPGWLAKRFIAERFGTRSTMVAAAKTVFSTPWLPEFALDLFIKVRLPGATAPTLSPSPAVLATELDGLANGFADAVEAARTWTER